jgi:hypothetical protein
MPKYLFRFISTIQFLIPCALFFFHCGSLPIDPAKFPPQNLKYEKTLYFLYVGDEINALASVEYAVDSFTINPPLPPELKFDKATGTISGKCDSVLPQKSFTIQAFNQNGSTACILDIEISPMPSFIVQPQNVNTKINEPVTFTAKATGKSPLKYSWLKDGVLIAGKDSSILTILSVSYLDTGSYRCKVVDSTGKTASSDPALCRIINTTTKPDSLPPDITLLSPAADTVIDVDSCSIMVRCLDDSGVASVNISVGSDTVHAVRGNSNVFTGMIKKLSAGQYTSVTIIAVDSSVAHNSKSVLVRIKYDNDTTSPIMTRVKPENDSVSTNATSYTIKVTCADPSGVSSVKGTFGSKSFIGTRSTGDEWTIVVSGLTEREVNTVIVTATDSSLRANQS